MSRPTPLKPMIPAPAEGQVIWLTVRISPSPVNLYRVQSIYQDGSYYAVQDVTARRLAEEARDKARSELARVARVISLGTLAASIAHEVNQPLSGIVTNGSTAT